MRQVHAVEFYDDDAALVAAVVAFMESALRAGDAALICATAPHGEMRSAALDERAAELNEGCPSACSARWSRCFGARARCSPRSRSRIFGSISPARTTFELLCAYPTGIMDPHDPHGSAQIVERHTSVTWPWSSLGRGPASASTA